ncbi:MAG: ComEC/Rec2 family competence protein [SAR324 cluster bacterium]|nr:ComEC/Rec2 family competence protein [SAR324 cluster bacterium]
MSWLLCSSLLVYGFCYYQLASSYWLITSLIINGFIYLTLLLFNSSRLVGGFLILVLVMSNFTYLSLLGKKLSLNKETSYDIEGEIIKIDSEKITIANAYLKGPFKKKILPLVEINFPSDWQLLLDRFRVKKKYLFKQLTFENSDLISYNFNYLPTSQYISTDLTKIQLSFFYHYMITKVSYYLTGDAKNIIKAVVLNNRRQVSPDLMDKINSIGISHLLSISALHLVQIFLLCQLVLYVLVQISHRFFETVYVNFLPETLSLAICFYYVNILDYPLPATRALIFLSFWVAAKNLLPYITPIYKFLIISTTMLAAEPWLVGSLSFLLSFLAVLGLILIHHLASHVLKYKNEFREKIANYFLLTFFGSCLISLIIMPINLLVFQGVNLLQPFSNIIHIPLASLIIIPYAFLIIPLLAFSYWAPDISFINYIIDIYFRGLQIIIDWWIKLIEINYKITGFASVNWEIKNSHLFVWIWVILVLFICLGTFYQMTKLKLTILNNQ